MIRLLSIPLFYFLLMLILLSTISCSKKEVRMIQTDEQLLEVTSDFCKEMYKKQKEGKLYSCASAISKDLQLSQTKSLLLAKVKIAEQVISTIDSKPLKTISDYYIYLDNCSDIYNAITPLLTSIPLQLLAYHIAVLKGCNVDQPRNLAKSVTVE